MRLGLSGRLRAYVLAVVGIALPVVVAAVVRVAVDPPTAAKGLPIAALLAMAFLADLKPVPLDERDGHAVSLAVIFVLVAGILFGWQYAVLIGCVSIVTAQLVDRRPLAKLAFNGAAYALAAIASSVPALATHLDPVSEVRLLAAISLTSGALFVGVNVLLVCGAVALHRGEAFRPLLAENIRHSGPAFVIMAFIAALATTLWTQEPEALVLLAGPLVTLTMYQRSALASKVASRAALIDNLTGLGNRRAFEAALQETLDVAAQTGGPVSLCIVDADNFKEINDIYGHPVGDNVLQTMAGLLSEQPGRAFRLGGDEFALIVEMDESHAHGVAEHVHHSLATGLSPDGPRLTVSIGLGSCPGHARDAVSLHQIADDALYWAKRHGRSRSCVFTPAIVRSYSPAELARKAERQARLRAAQNLVRVVDAKDTYVGMHSHSVARIAVQIARELGLEQEDVAHIELAGRLHDLGKIAIPDHVLRKPAALDVDETQLMRTHPDLGSSLLDGLDIDPVDVWIRHHHEHWDGSGYPHGLAAEEIPLGSRIILVADAFDAMTTDRTYRRAMPASDALRELWHNAGTQFDPAIVAALTRCLDRTGAADTRPITAPTPIRVAA